MSTVRDEGNEEPPAMRLGTPVLSPLAGPPPPPAPALPLLTSVAPHRRLHLDGSRHRSHHSMGNAVLLHESIPPSITARGRAMYPLRPQFGHQASFDYAECEREREREREAGLLRPDPAVIVAAIPQHTPQPKVKKRGLLAKGASYDLASSRELSGSMQSLNSLSSPGNSTTRSSSPLPRLSDQYPPTSAIFGVLPPITASGKLINFQAENDAREVARLKHEMDSHLSSASRILNRVIKRVNVVQAELATHQQSIDTLQSSRQGQQAEVGKLAARAETQHKTLKQLVDTKLSSVKSQLRNLEAHADAFNDQLERAEYHVRRNSGEIDETIDLIGTYFEQIQRLHTSVQHKPHVTNQIRGLVAKLLLTSLSYLLNTIAIILATFAKVKAACRALRSSYWFIG